MLRITINGVSLDPSSPQGGRDRQGGGDPLQLHPRPSVESLTGERLVSDVPLKPQR
jgi:hypothetical protein